MPPTKLPRRRLLLGGLLGVLLASLAVVTLELPWRERGPEPGVSSARVGAPIPSRDEHTPPPWQPPFRTPGGDEDRRPPPGVDPPPSGRHEPTAEPRGPSPRPAPRRAAALRCDARRNTASRLPARRRTRLVRPGMLLDSSHPDAIYSMIRVIQRSIYDPDRSVRRRAAGMNEPSEQPPAAGYGSRLILLGASNLSLNLPAFLRRALGADGSPTPLPTPIDIRLAAGFGRSFGRSSRFLGRVLPGILEGDLFPALESLSAHDRDIPTFALVTDIGNDIGYEVEPARLIEWVEACLARIHDSQPASRVVTTALPVASLCRISARHYRIARSILFPRCRLPVAEMRRRVCAVDEAIRHIAHRESWPVVEPPAAWYGIDPIHVRRQYRAAFRDSIFDAWDGAARRVAPEKAGADRALPQYEEPWPGRGASWRRRRDALSLPRRLWFDAWVWTRWPKRRRVLGTIHLRAQPAGRFSDGSTLSVY